VPGDARAAASNAAAPGQPTPAPTTSPSSVRPALAHLGHLPRLARHNPDPRAQPRPTTSSRPRATTRTPRGSPDQRTPEVDPDRAAARFFMDRAHQAGPERIADARDPLRAERVGPHLAHNLSAGPDHFLDQAEDRFGDDLPQPLRRIRRTAASQHADVPPKPEPVDLSLIDRAINCRPPPRHLPMPACNRRTRPAASSRRRPSVRHRGDRPHQTISGPSVRCCRLSAVRI